MARKSSTNKTPDFKSEAEEADWYHTPEGKRYVSRRFSQAVRKGVTVVEARTSEEAHAALEQARREGRAVRFKGGYPIKRTDPAVLQKLYDEALAKITKPISLRLPVREIEAAKAIAAKAGIGYQTVLKEIISKGLRRSKGLNRRA